MLPRTLKNFNVFVDTHSWAGVAESVTIPKITKKTEDFRGAGMIGDVALSMGYEKLEGEVVYAGFDIKQYRQLGVCGTSDLPVRFVGMYERQDNCTSQIVEIYTRGQAIELDPGDSKNGEKTEIKMSYNYTYYRMEVDGVVEVELDFINGTERFGETDVAKSIKELLGL
ncbi:MAG: phage major tail tube protein [Acinetobacter johnsonii]|uniref:Phage major tail tube protein n=2 Tax=Acinetobacter johnsonii TaxID=40214 RepID=N9BDY7_ACIJO|nr:phage major tail tube protein [Acinetobacter johnsonii]ENV71471.1 phage major tail tube protein [Acinetobacter johnsonii ANC 3681]PZQ92323.1 MAG: phage major tail tube protein [Acinetobacter johnsonii]